MDNSSISVIAIVVSSICTASTAIVAICNIRRMGEVHRVSAVHDRMVSCMTETLQLAYDILLLLDGVANQIVYTDRRTGEVTETAYKRFARIQPEKAQQFNSLTAKHELFFPGEVFLVTTKLLNSLNTAIKLAYRKKSDEGRVYPENDDLQCQVQKSFQVYEESMELFRKYVGSNALTGLGNRPNKLATHEAIQRNRQDDLKETPER